jgi:hypothetical protein
LPSSYSSVAHEIHPVDDPFLARDHWLTFNRQLGRDAAGLPNEAFLDQFLDRVQEFAIVDPRVFWLTISRIAEMTIKLAGDCADSCEFQAAGDLLVNPRGIDIYQRGDQARIQKERHGSLSEQFAAVIGSQNPVAWLKRETHLQIKSEALLPHLNGLLRSSGFVAPEYLYGLEQRMCRVADTIAFLSAWQITDHQKLDQQLQHASPADRELIVTNLCRFDDHCFIEMGEDIERMILHGDERSRFLKQRQSAACRG